MAEELEAPKTGWVITPASAAVTIVDRDQATIQVSPPRKKVAIIGFASNTLHLVPWDDPTFELWGLNQGHMNFKRRADRWFEMHLPDAVTDVRDPQYLDFLKKLDIPLYMIQRYEEFPTSCRYPIEDAIQYVGRDYFQSSPAFMAILAAMEGFEEIHFYGINLAIGDEYFYEKPNMEFLLGLLEGKGIKCVVPHASALLKQYRRYGYFVDARPAQQLKTLLNARIQEYRTRIERHQADFHTTLGAMREAEALIQVAEGQDHGADIVLQVVST